MDDLIERLQRDDGFGSYDLRKQALERIADLEKVKLTLETLKDMKDERIAELEAKVAAQAEYIMISNRVNNNLKKQLKEGE